MNRCILLSLLLSLSLQIFGQEIKNILFLGNSYTYYNGDALPQVLQQFALYHGDTVIYDKNTPGGYQFVQHIGNTTSLNKIRQGSWDYVVLQEQSQKPSFPPAQVATDVYPYAAQLNDTIEKYNACGETVFFMTWGRENGDQTNCASYPPICTYYGMQQRLRESYLEMSDDNNAICSPVGAVWSYVRDSFPLIDLYAADGSHPSYAGSYLAACTFYATIFERSPEGIPYYGSLTQADAENLQQAAAKVVLDSLSNWYIGAYDLKADFNYSLSNGLVDFANVSTNANQYYWDFGTGDSSIQSDPAYTYSTNGTYSIILIASDSCGNSDTITQILEIECAEAMAADFSFVVAGDSANFTNASTNATDFVWNFGDGNSSTDLNPTHIYDSSGTYNVLLIATDTCGNIDSLLQTVSITIITSIRQSTIPEKLVFCYPNPTTGELTIEADQKLGMIRLLDASGKVVLATKKRNTSKIVLSLQGQPKGLYFVEGWRGEQRTFMEKIILK